MITRIKVFLAVQIITMLLVGWLIASYVSNYLEFESQSYSIIMVLNYISSRAIITDRKKHPYLNTIFTAIWFSIFCLTSGLHFPEGKIEYLDGFPKIGILLSFLVSLVSIHIIIVVIEKAFKKHIPYLYAIFDLATLFIITYFWLMIVENL